MNKIFWFHYNKPASTKRGKPTITIHYNKACHLVNNVIINTNTWGRIRNKQPKFVICGRYKKINIVNDVAYIK